VLEVRRPTAGWRAKALALGLVPGVAHILVLDRPGVGTGLFVLFVLGAYGAVTGLCLVEEAWADRLYLAGCSVAGGTWLVGFLDAARLAVFRDYAKRAEMRDRLTKEGVHHYAGGHMKKARACFRRCLSLDSRDPDVLFWYGCAEARLGRSRRALRSFRRCRKYDLEGKWSFEIEREEARVAAGEFETGVDTGAAPIGSGGDAAPGGAK
jgi:hypothetical protein